MGKKTRYNNQDKPNIGTSEEGGGIKQENTCVSEKRLLLKNALWNNSLPYSYFGLHGSHFIKTKYDPIKLIMVRVTFFLVHITLLNYMKYNMTYLNFFMSYVSWHITS